ncbi:terminase small subunit [Clostridium sp. ZBS14]|uniref:terminase small subunit n=1 Tax=Clostridium sp. ZBS14 TaxID=2949970 RepID=UPI00339076EB
MAKMTTKQKRFCNEYLIDLNATQAAIRAGYSVDSAKVIGCENLTKPNVKSYLDRRIAKREVRTEITQDKVLNELAKIGFANIDDYVVVDSSSGYDKVRALENIGRHLGMFKDKLEISGTNEIQIKLED